MRTGHQRMLLFVFQVGLLCLFAFLEVQAFVDYKLGGLVRGLSFLSACCVSIWMWKCRRLGDSEAVTRGNGFDVALSATGLAIAVSLCTINATLFCALFATFDQIYFRL